MKLSQSFVPFDKNAHLVKEFYCGKPSMNNYISRFAMKHVKLGLSYTMVLPVDDPEAIKKPIAAYYTLGGSTVTKEEIPTTQSLPPYKLPVVLVARLAVDVNFQGEGLGAKTLISALRHAVRLCDAGLPAYGLILDVLDESALKFYQRFDFFQSFTDDPMRLFSPMNALRKL